MLGLTVLVAGIARAGIGRSGRIRAGTILIPRGEFSIVIAGPAVAAGAHASIGPLAAAYVLILAIVAPLAARGITGLLKPSTTPPAP